MSVLNVTSGGSTGYVGGKEIWNLRIEGAYGPVGYREPDSGKYSINKYTGSYLSVQTLLQTK